MLSTAGNTANVQKPDVQNPEMSEIRVFEFPVLDAFASLDHFTLFILYKTVQASMKWSPDSSRVSENQTCPDFRHLL